MSESEKSTDTWRSRLATVVETMKELSLQTNPQDMVRNYVRRMQAILPGTQRISLSRRGLESPEYRVTRYSEWTEEINPWKEPGRLPLLSGGILGELLYADEPVIVEDFTVGETDPAKPFLQGQRSLLAIPLFDQGISLNMVVVTSPNPHAFPHEELPERVRMANLFGLATQNLVLAEQLDSAYHAVEKELKVVADIQRSLLPRTLPKISTLDLAAYYQTSRQAGGDYYDFFPLPNDCWGILIADVSGHGTPAAVMMAVTHCIAHMHPGPAIPPEKLLSFLNQHLTARYTPDSGHFITAFYGIYDPAARTLTYSNAGHNPPRLRFGGNQQVVPIDRASSLPLGIFPDVNYTQHVQTLAAGDRIVLYTDGITEAGNGFGDLFGTTRLDHLIGDYHQGPEATITMVLDMLQAFTQGLPANDDRTLLIFDVK